MNTLTTYINIFVPLGMFILTFYYVRYTKNILQANIEMVKEATRPEVIAFFREDNGFLYFQIKNIGKRLAKEVKVTFNPGFNMWSYLYEVDFWQRGVKVIAPDQKFETFVYIIDEFKKEYNELVQMHPDNASASEATVFFEYKDEEGNTYKSTYDVSLLDFITHQGRKTYDMTNLVKELSSINKTISEISSALNKDN